MLEMSDLGIVKFNPVTEKRLDEQLTAANKIFIAAFQRGDKVHAQMWKEVSTAFLIAAFALGIVKAEQSK